METLTPHGTEIAALQPETAGSDALSKRRVTGNIGTALVLLGSLMAQANAEDKTDAPSQSTTAPAAAESAEKMKVPNLWGREDGEILKPGDKSLMTIDGKEYEVGNSDDGLLLLIGKIEVDIASNGRPSETKSVKMGSYKKREKDTKTGKMKDVIEIGPDGKPRTAHGRQLESTGVSDGFEGTITIKDFEFEKYLRALINGETVKFFVWSESAGAGVPVFSTMTPRKPVVLTNDKPVAVPQVKKE